MARLIATNLRPTSRASLHEIKSVAGSLGGNSGEYSAARNSLYAHPSGGSDLNLAKF